MASSSILRFPSPPDRQLKPTVKIWHEPGSQQTGFPSLSVHFSELTDRQSAHIVRALPHLLAVISHVRRERLEAAKQGLSCALELSSNALWQLNAHAAEMHEWRTSVLNALPWTSVLEATTRCEGGPWNAWQDLLVLPHKGRLHVPLFLFAPEGPPSATWIALLNTLRASKPSPADWDLLAWLLRPHPLLNDRAPMVAYPDDPAEVRLKAESAAKDARV